MDESKHRWFYPAPSWLIYASLLVTALLFLSERWRWFPFNAHKGWTVLIAMASVGVVLVAMLLGFVVALVFRWRFQFSIRALLVLVVAVALPCSWLAVEIKKARGQSAAIEAIEEVGGNVKYDDPMDASGNRVWLAPNWLRAVFGDDMFDPVVGVQTWEDAALEHIGGLPDPESLDFVCGVGISDKGLARLKEASGLRRVRFGGLEKVTAAGLANLHFLTHLQRLDMKSLPETGVGVECLQGLTELEEVSLSTDATDAWLTHLAALPKLSKLNLAATRVTVAGLAYLEHITTLRELTLPTTVSDNAAKKLQQVLPNCKIRSPHRETIPSSDRATDPFR